MLTKEQLDQIIYNFNHGLPTGYTDEEYDALLEEYLQAHGGESARPYIRSKQSDGVNQLVSTLPKVYGVSKPMRPGQKTYDQWVITNKLTNQYVMVQPKFDGCSVAVDFTTNRFFTRGDYDNGESVDVTELFEYQLDWLRDNVIWGDCYEKTNAMKFEAILSHEQFRDLQLHLKYKRPRDAVAAAITSRDKELARHITLVPLRGYLNGRQYVPNILSRISKIIPCDAFDYMESFIMDILNNDATYKIWEKTFSIDGVVVSVMQDSVINDDKQTITVPYYDDPDKEVAIKILYNVQKTKLKTVDFQFGKQGRITPVAILEPVKFDNVTVDHVTLSTLERVTELDLRHNDTVEIMYNIVPYLIDSEHDGDYRIQVPQNCPICGAPLNYASLKQVRCTNPNCDGLRLGSIIRYAEKMKMVGVSKGTITRLFDEGIIHSIPDLLQLKQTDFKHLDGFGDISANNIVQSIRDQSANVSVTRFLGALPINDTSEETWKCITNAIGNVETIGALLDGTIVDAIMNAGYIPGVGELKLKKIIDGYVRHVDEIKECIKLVSFDFHGNNWKKNMGRVCLTGTRDADITTALENSGYEVGGFSKDCKFVVIPYEGFTSAKTEKAKEFGIPVYTIDYVKWHHLKPF